MIENVIFIAAVGIAEAYIVIPFALQSQTGAKREISGFDGSNETIGNGSVIPERPASPISWFYG